LGVECIWLSPTFPSPNLDWGYDVADYYDMHPELGTLDDLDELVADAHERDIRVVLDLVPNHTSAAHPWFEDARSSRTAEHRDWYVWADPKPDGSAPNNWTSSFMGPAWTLDERTGQYYLHNFLPSQPDLNWWNPDVRTEFDRILRFWFDRGVDGFRIDVAHMVIKDRELRDNPPATASDFLFDQLRGQVPLYNSNRPEVHDLYRDWRAIADSYDPSRMLVGETFVDDLEQLVSYYGTNDELSLAFNIPFLTAPYSLEALREVVERTESLLPVECCPVWTGSNHDMSRFPTRWAGGDAARARCALVMLLTLRGTAFLYYGDELAMPDTDVPLDRLVDPVSIEYQPVLNRDAARTPMPWNGEDGAGFTDAGVEPWLPFGDAGACNVADQRDDPTSAMHLTRDLVSLRSELHEVRDGAYATHTAEGEVWAWTRGERVLIAVNGTDAETTVAAVRGTIRICTDRARDNEPVDGGLRLGPSEAVVVEL
jgi:alpha-glucosidase